jgi:hypothetical protein
MFMVGDLSHEADFWYQHVTEEDRIRILFCERAIKRERFYPVVPFPPAEINDFPLNYCILGE